MILRTEVYWEGEKDLDKLPIQEKERIEAEKEVLGDDFDYSKLIEKGHKECIIDTFDDKIYINLGDSIVVRSMFDGEFIPFEVGEGVYQVNGYFAQYYIKADLDDIHYRLLSDSFDMTEEEKQNEIINSKSKIKK